MQPILHRSLKSPYAQKVRAVMGYLDLNYFSFVAPKGLPRPVEEALVGPYARRIPILQIGADLYCDSELIMRFWQAGPQTKCCSTIQIRLRHAIGWLGSKPEAPRL